MHTVSGIEVRLHWRDLPNTDFALRRPPAPQFKPAEDGTWVYMPFRERDLVLALSGVFDGGLDWRCDALMICRSQIDWNTVYNLLRWRSRAKIRLAELRRNWDAAVPEHVGAKLRRAPIEGIITAPLRAYRQARMKLLERQPK
jgi:hypothetical protein